MPYEQRAQALKLTVVVDNLVDIFLSPKGPWLYPVPGPSSSLWAEQGLSLWMQVTGGDGMTVSLLYDFGRSGAVLNHNLRILMPDGPSVDMLVLSHGHIDHYGGLGAYLDDGGSPTTLLTHPSSFGSRGIRRPGGGVAGPWVFEKRTVLDWGLDLETTAEPRHLGPGLWSTGAIDRHSPLDIHLDRAVRWGQNDELTPDGLEDDQALVVCLEGLGLVVITGCCHAGVINTLDAAARMFPNEPLYALIGGLHLNHLEEDQVRAIAAEIEARQPRWVLPMHCTGAMAIRTLHQCFGDRCLTNTVGLSLDTTAEQG
jgi:7,8-dihydropterin-6-yl-methyl-4-(beta-D-ribofuranosyl)aminobenzene 5'-phosphate synthase